MSGLQFLLLEDSLLDTELIHAALHDGGIDCELLRVQTRQEFVSAIETSGFDIILSDYALPGFDGFTALELARAACPETPFIFVSATLGEELAIETLKSGATDYVLKQRLGRLVPSVQRALREIQKQRERQAAETALQQVEDRYRLLFEKSPLGVLLVDIDDRSLVEFNAQAYRSLGYTKEEFARLKISEIEISDSPTAAWFQHDRVLAERAAQFETKLRTKSRQLRDVWVSAQIIQIEQKRYLHGIIQDITDRKQAEAALSQSEAKFRSLVQNSSDIVTVFDPVGNILYGSASIERLLGYPLAELIGKNGFQYIHPEDAMGLFESFRGFAQIEGKQVTVECRTRHRDGSWRDFESIAINRLSDPAVNGVVINSRDITDRKQAEAALRHTEARFKRLVEFNLIGCMFWDSEGQILDANDAFLNMIGYSREDLLADRINWRQMTPPDQLGLSEAAIGQMRRTGTAPLLEKEYIHKDGSRVTVLLGGVLFEDSQSQGVSFVLNLTERKRAEQALKTRSDRLRLLFETSSDLLLNEQPLQLLNSLFDRLSNQLALDAYFNFLMEPDSDRLRLADYGGLSEEQAESIATLQASLCAQVAQDRCQIVLNEVQQSVLPEAEALRRFGATAYAGQPLISRGKILGTLSFISRTRTHLSAEEAAVLQAVSDQFAVALERASLMESLQQQTEQLRQANRIKDEFLAVLSHELRTPLNPILGWARLLRTKQYSEETTSKALETIERNARIQTQLIEDLLDVSRILQGKLRLTVSPVELIPIVEAALDTVQLSAEAKSIQIQTHLDPQVGRVLGDASRLQQVFWNLISNAVKFTPVGGSVEVTLSIAAETEVDFLPPITPESLTVDLRRSQMTQTYAQLRIQDTGKGIEPSFLPYVFDYFRQAEGGSTRSFGGLGLGLAIVRYLVELHGGSIRAESPGDGQGSTFTVWLPLPHAEPVPASATIAAAPLSNPLLQQVRVLVVEDNPDTLEFITFLLEQEGAIVLATTSVEQALQQLDQMQPDLLISDIGMPQADGYVLISAIRSRLGTPGASLPAIALTAYAKVEDRDRALAAGFQRHITKPIEPEALLTCIADLMQLEPLPPSDRSLG